MLLDKGSDDDVKLQTLERQDTDVDCRQASRAHSLCVYEATLLEVVQNEVWRRLLKSRGLCLQIKNVRK